MVDVVWVIFLGLAGEKRTTEIGFESFDSVELEARTVSDFEAPHFLDLRT